VPQAAGAHGDYIVSFVGGSDGQVGVSKMGTGLSVPAANSALPVRLEPEGQNLDEKAGGAVGARN
jgi:hypothetical protein